MGGFGSADPKASQRALLDQLMGAERDLDLESKAKKKFWEKDVCKLYLAGLSPYKLLKETRGFVANGYDVWVKHAYAYALRLDCRPDDVDCERWKVDHNLKAQYVVGSQSVLQTMYATRILSNVSADGASDLARWIRCIIVFILRYRIRNGEIGHARLH